jgi:hypothetical protein
MYHYVFYFVTGSLVPYLTIDLRGLFIGYLEISIIFLYCKALYCMYVPCVIWSLQILVRYLLSDLHKDVCPHFRRILSFEVAELVHENVLVRAD